MPQVEEDHDSDEENNIQYSHNHIPSQHENLNSEKIYQYVVCSHCKTDVGFVDSTECYFFNNVIPSHI